MFVPTNAAAKSLAVILLAILLAACDEDDSAQYQFDPAAAVHPGFSGDRAYEHVQKLVDFGPRPAGSNALENSRVYIEEQLKELGWVVIRQSFTDKAPNGASIDFVNLRARFGNADDVTFWDQKRAILLGSHYDTKRYTDFEFVGANDGGSSTGVLIEIARVAKTKPEFAKQIELVFFDGE
ncbi:MAG: M28 family peptidase, partial [Verrucomicrobiota bacterium]